MEDSDTTDQSRRVSNISLVLLHFVIPEIQWLQKYSNGRGLRKEMQTEYNWQLNSTVRTRNILITGILSATIFVNKGPAAVN